jgi:hypothetical protein
VVERVVGSNGQFQRCRPRQLLCHLSELCSNDNEAPWAQQPALVINLQLTSLPSSSSPWNVMSSSCAATRIGHQSAVDILAKLFKSIGASVPACCWHVNGHDDHKEAEQLALHNFLQ